MIVDVFEQGRWILNRGALHSPCDGGGCKRHILKGEWYWRSDAGWLFCSDCTPEQLQVRGPDSREPGKPRPR
jgi:hypothetical protein